MGIGASVLLLAIGAILAFAVQLDSTPVAGISIQWDTIGVILMIVGAIGMIWSLYAISSWRDRSVHHTTDEVVHDRDRIIER